MCFDFLLFWDVWFRAKFVRIFSSEFPDASFQKREVAQVQECPPISVGASELSPQWLTEALTKTEPHQKESQSNEELTSKFILDSISMRLEESNQKSSSNS